MGEPISTPEQERTLHRDREPLVDTIQRVARGEHLIDEDILTHPAIASKVLSQFNTLAEETKEREKKASGGKTAYENAAEKGAKVAGRRLDEDERKKIGSAIHWTVGVSSGAMYGLLRNRSRHVGFGSGLAYGLATYLAIDEGLLSAMKLTPPPDAFPWQTHARGLAGHLILGLLLDGTFDVADLI